MLIGMVCAGIASAQEPGSRVAAIEQAQDAKAEHLTPAAPGKAELYVTRISDMLLSGQLHWHTFWQSAYSGGGFTLGAGYSHHVSPYNLLDVRGSITFSGYKRIEAELLAPELGAGTTVLLLTEAPTSVAVDDIDRSCAFCAPKRASECCLHAEATAR